MNNISLFLLVVLIFLSPFPSLASPQTEPRIISLKPNITEILFTLGLGDQIVGVTTYCDSPPQAQKIDKVGDYVHVDVEKIMTLKPTLVIGSEENSLKKGIEFLKNQGISVYLLPFGRLEESLESMVRLAEILGVREKGELLVSQLKEQLAVLQRSSHPASSLKTLMVVGRRPLVVVGGKNMFDDLATLLHINNVARNSRLRYPSYSIDQLIAAEPEVILDLSMGSEESDETESRRWYQQFKSIPAVAKGQIYFLNISDFRASPRLIEGAKKLTEIFEKLE